jgi:release factor glutamine methyltransferase
MSETTFYGLEFLTAPGRVFTPRATTEALVDAALALIGTREVRVADVGTGSGAIGVAIAVRAPQTEVWATDTNPEAVALARENARRHGVDDRVHVVEGDLLEPLPEGFDFVIANLPYLPLATREAPEHEPLRAEPEDAVYAPGDGLGPLHGLLALCNAGKLRMPGYVLVQFHGDVLEADCQHLDELDAQLIAEARTAA